jgi:hypothetical protein
MPFSLSHSNQALSMDLDQLMIPHKSANFARDYQVRRKPNWNWRGSNAAVGAPAWV